LLKGKGKKSSARIQKKEEGALRIGIETNLVGEGAPKKAMTRAGGASVPFAEKRV